MKRSELLQRGLASPLDAIQTCRDIVEGNFNAMPKDEFDWYDLLAKIFTDLQILAMNQAPVEEEVMAGSISEFTRIQEERLGDMLIDVDPGDETEPSSAAR